MSGSFGFPDDFKPVAKLRLPAIGAPLEMEGVKESLPIGTGGLIYQTRIDNGEISNISSVQHCRLNFEYFQTFFT